MDFDFFVEHVLSLSCQGTEAVLCVYTNYAKDGRIRAQTSFRSFELRMICFTILGI